MCICLHRKEIGKICSCWSCLILVVGLQIIFAFGIAKYSNSKMKYNIKYYSLYEEMIELLLLFNFLNLPKQLIERFNLIKECILHITMSSNKIY